MNGRHWRVKQREHQRWREIVTVVCGRPKKRVEGRVALQVTMMRWNRQDKDNRYASVKPLVDAFKNLGWCVDDSDKWLDLSVSEVVERDKSQQGTIVEWRQL
tara:strand:+ start:3109 stop:3414 length:306 start_codon:yes stop_codon:yes gene_type:complete